MKKCPICEANVESEDICNECGYEFQEPLEEQYSLLVDKIYDIGNKLSTSKNISDQELEKSYGEVVIALKQIVEDNSKNFKFILSSLKDTDRMNEISDSYNKLNTDLNKIGKDLEFAINKIGETLFHMKNLKDADELSLANSRLEEAIGEIEHALSEISNLEGALLKAPETMPPIDIEAPSELISEAIDSLNLYAQTSSVDELKKAVDLLAEAEDYLISYISQHDPNYLADDTEEYEDENYENVIDTLESENQIFDNNDSYLNSTESFIASSKIETSNYEPDNKPYSSLSEDTIG